MSNILHNATELMTYSLKQRSSNAPTASYTHQRHLKRSTCLSISCSFTPPFPRSLSVTSMRPTSLTLSASRELSLARRLSHQRPLLYRSSVAIASTRRCCPLAGESQVYHYRAFAQEQGRRVTQQTNARWTHTLSYMRNVNSSINKSSSCRKRQTKYPSESCHGISRSLRTAI